MTKENAISVKNLTFIVENKKIILHDLTFDLPWKSKLLLVGANGAGKIYR